MARRLVRLTAGPAAYWRWKAFIQRAATLGDGADQSSDDIAFGAPQSGTVAAGKAGYGREGTQPAGTAANPRPAQTNHLTGNATRRGGQVAKPPDTA